MTRENAKQILQSGELYESIRIHPDDNRAISRYSSGIHCESLNRYDPEFVTDDIEVALNYIYPN